MTTIQDTVPDVEQQEETLPPVGELTPEELLARIRQADTTTLLLLQPEISTIERLLTQVRETHAKRQDARQEHRALIERIEEFASQKAQDEDWCGEFEENMERLGLTSRREQKRTIEATVTIEATLDLDALDLDIPEIDCTSPDDVRIDGTVDLEYSVGITYTHTGDGCGCEMVDGGDYISFPNELTIMSTEVTCDHCH